MRKGLFCSAAAIVLATAAGSAAIAQDGATNDEDDVIVVTARKIQESIDDAPLAVSVIDDEALENLSVQTGIDLVRQIPSATFVSGGPEYLADISIRGQGAGRLGFTESATGIYRNGIYVAGGGFGGRSFNRIDLFDIRTIETYRGPQSALYGRNAVGGAVNVITNKPDPEAYSGRVKYGYENIDRHNVEAVLNAPLSDNAAVRFGGFFTDQNDGFYTDVNTGEALDTQQNWGARGALRALFGERTDATVTVEYYSNEAPSFSILGRRLPIDNGGQPIGGQTDPSEFERNSSSIGRVEIDEIAVFGELESDLEFADLTAVFAFKDRDGERFNDDLDHFLGFEGVGGTNLVVAQQEDFKRYGGEIRLSSKAGGAWQWLVGADFQTFSDDVELQNSGSSFVPPLAALATRTDSSSEDLTSFSFFGLLGYDLSDRVNVSVESRVVRDSKDFSFTRTQNGVTIISTGDLERSEAKFLPAATLKYDLEDYGNVYFRFASGYRPFGFNTAVSDLDFVPYEGEEAHSFELGWKGTTSGGGLRYGLAGFYMITDNPQLSTAISTTDTSTALQNVSGSDIYGLEAELNWRQPIGSGVLVGGISASTIFGEFDDNTSLLVSVGGAGIVEFDLSGARVPRTRDYIVALNSFYTFPVANGVDAFFGGSLQAEGGGYENAVGDSPTRFGSGIPNTQFTGRSLDHFLLGDLRGGLSGEHWRIAGYVRNISNEVYLLQNVLQNEFYNEPRKYGFEVTLQF